MKTRKLEYFERELEASPTGREILDVVRSHMEEISRLVNKNRVVMVAWQRNHGPRFLTSAMDSGFDENTQVTKEVEGVTLQQLLLRMADALQRAGGAELKASIARYAAPTFTAASECGSLAEVFGRIRAGTLAGRAA